MNVAIVFLTYFPKDATMDFVDEMSKKFNTYVIVDSNEIKITQSKQNPRYIQIKDEECIERNYINSNLNTHIKRNPCAWDKAIYHFTKKTNYDFVLFIEDDVFIPSVEAIELLIENSKGADLVCRANRLKKDSIIDWHWGEVAKRLEPPFYSSMACCIGVSRKLLNEIDKFVSKHKTLLHIEAMFNTLAMQANLKVLNPKTLRSIVWKGEWQLNDYIRLKHNFFHPSKDIENHNKYRELIKDDNLSLCIPKQELVISPRAILEIPSWL